LFVLAVCVAINAGIRATELNIPILTNFFASAKESTNIIFSLQITICPVVADARECIPRTFVCVISSKSSK
jgi:hypothetical protein